MSPLSKAKVSPFCLVRGVCFGVSGRGSDHSGGRSGCGCGAGCGEALEPARGGGAPGPWRSAGEAPGGALPGAWRRGPGFGSPRQAPEQRDRRVGAPCGGGPGSGALPGLRADVRVREAGGGSRAPAVEGDAAPLDDRGRALAGQVAPRCPRAPEPAASGVRWGPGPDRRLAARLVRGPGARLHADRLRGRRDDAAAGGGVL